MELIVSDNHKGLVKALRSQWQATCWQQCQTHLTRNILSACPDKEQAGLHKQLRHLFEAQSPTVARQVLQEILAAYGKTAPKAVDYLEAAFDDATAVLFLPERYRKRLRTTNSQERLNEEVRRRERVIRIFPNAASAERLLGALLMEFDEAFSTGHRYFDMSEYWTWKQQQEPAEAQQQAA